MTALKPTDEQQEIVDAFGWGEDLVIEAGAGTGKTSTLKLLAGSTRERGVYLAYNKAIAADAARAFPGTVQCKTAHALAYAAIGNRYRARLDAPRVPAKEVARLLGINEPLRIADGIMPLSPQQLARIVTATIDRFCYSADPEPAAQHVPGLARLDEPGLRGELARAILPWVGKAWADLRSPGGRLRFTHDVYLKLWQLSGPDLACDFVMLDEAQDANPAVASIVDNQPGQRILVGDACQAIYGWRGAVDAMANFAGTRLQLSQSFRFGPAIAAEANKWLKLLDAQLRLSGHQPIRSTLNYVDRPDAVLCRSNGGAVNQILDGLKTGRRVALVGGGADIKRMAEAAQRLQRGEPCDHAELLAFTTWREVQEYVEESSGSDLKVFVDLIDRQGTDAIIDLVDKLVDEDHADLVVSTAHKAKGREWGTVTIAGDFREPADDDSGMPGSIPRDVAMLAYVAVTRAKLQLDRGGLSWVDRHHQWAEVGRPEDEAYAAILERPGSRPALPEETPGEPELVREADPWAAGNVAGLILARVDAPPAPEQPEPEVEPCPETVEAMTRLRSAVAAAEQRQQPAPAPDLQVDQLVRYRSDPTSAFTLTVRAVRASLGVGWVADLEQRNGQMQRSINADLLEPVPDDYGPTEAFGWPLAPDCRLCTLPFLDCSCPTAPDRRTDEQVYAHV